MEDGSLSNSPYWNFTDWVDNSRKWRFGVPPIDKDGCSSILDFQLLMAYQLAAKLESDIGITELAKKYEKKSEALIKTIRTKYWDESRKLYADSKDKNSFSQHANILAILTSTVQRDEAITVCENLLTDNSLTQTSIYFRYYLNQALVKVGLGDRYIDLLSIWRKNIELGMTTWGETSDVEATRSDCHAWGASPNIEFFRIVLGIDSDSPGFKTVRIEPHLGSIKNLSGVMPHPSGKIAVTYKITDNQMRVYIGLPKGITGKFFWKGKKYDLLEEKNVIEL